MTETIFGIAGTATSAPQPTIYAFLFFFGSILIGSSGSIWVKRHANLTQDVHNSTNSFNVLLVLFETVFFLVASIVVGLLNADVATFSWDFGTIICVVIRAVAYVLGMVGYLMAVRHGPLLLTVVILRMGLAIPILLSAVIWPEGNPVAVQGHIGGADDPCPYPLQQEGRRQDGGAYYPRLLVLGADRYGRQRHGGLRR